ncbi:hypothetical protein ACFV80_41205 [Streptomyces sp. NPDC059862]|uniref:hypothetical protein n=1 Tax=Streptomyces sp. NPDC059862 TaxID=3346975 RepID=UPI003656E14F
MAHNIGNPTDAQRRRGWKFGIGICLVSTALASGAMLVTSASAAVAAPSSAVTVLSDDDSGNPPHKSSQGSKGDLRYYNPHTIANPPFPYPPVCEKKPYLPNCGPQW